jgi:hypothetical protein
MRHVLGEHVLQHRSYEAPWFSGSFRDDHGDAPLSGDFQLRVGLFHPAKEVELPSWQNDGPSNDEGIEDPTRQIHEGIRLCPPHKERDDGSEPPKNPLS